jgi:hypothetical protein
MDQSCYSDQLIHRMISDSPEPSDTIDVKKYTKYEFVIDESLTGKNKLELPLCECESRVRKFTFHLSFNHGDGSKYNEYVNRVEYIESVNLHYKAETINDPMIQQRQKEIETLKKERCAMCDLIDGTLIQDDLICHTIRENYPRFYEIKTVNEMNSEFDLINKQIQIHNSEIQKFKQVHVANDSVSVNIGFLKRVWEPDSISGPFKLGDGEYYGYLTDFTDEGYVGLTLERHESLECECE